MERRTTPRRRGKKCGRAARFSLVLQLILLLGAGHALAAARTAGDVKGVSMMAIELRSSAFENHQSIPTEFTCDGTDTSPPLSWSGVPKSAASLALIVDDPDAPSGTFVHWVLYDLPVDRRELAPGAPPGESFAGGRQGRNDFGTLGYGGPCPPGGTHRYFFKLYALDSRLDLEAGASKQALLQAMEGHVVGQGELLGSYSR